MILYLESRDDVSLIIFCNVHVRARNYIEDEVRTCNVCTVVSSVCV